MVSGNLITVLSMHISSASVFHFDADPVWFKIILPNWSLHQEPNIAIYKTLLPFMLNL
jgi:hypothetical protein